MGYREYVEKGPMPPRDEMKKFVRANAQFERRTEVVPLLCAVGRVAAEDIAAQTVLPKLPVSRMDGIAVRFSDFAGKMPDTSAWQEGTDYVFANTGCAVPPPYDTVILIEDVRFADRKLQILSVPKVKGQLIDPPGSFIGKDEILVRRYEKITPPLAGLLASGGIKTVKVMSKPRIAFVPTGDELVSWKAEAYPADKNVESNSVMLEGFAKLYGAELTVFDIVPDDRAAIAAALNEAAQTADLILINAGSSKGTKDFNLDVLEEEGKVLVYELGCRPGKHSSFSLLHNKPVLGIAGPPNGAELAMRFYLKSLVAEYYHQPEDTTNTLNVSLDFDFTAPANADFCLQVHIYQAEGIYRAQMIRPKAVTRSTLLHEYNGFIYVPKNTVLKAHQQCTAELIVDVNDIRTL